MEDDTDESDVIHLEDVGFTCCTISDVNGLTVQLLSMEAEHHGKIVVDDLSLVDEEAIKPVLDAMCHAFNVGVDRQKILQAVEQFFQFAFEQEYPLRGYSAVGIMTNTDVRYVLKDNATGDRVTVTPRKVAVRHRVYRSE